ncbi:methionine/alanine import family NSS transporter small subunit [Actinomyces howellii]|uniref:Methionine and alanine importer, small subunit n=1 Tax=Actinomyces howellii TaxID=52771 RepID=A0A448HDA7_9ACTO|nr:methionine/alanine import family NSS transporter small subunit [Actinomyces howellii]VEG25674.1 Uncharacterised protein [Actinomyces howellii]
MTGPAILLLIAAIVVIWGGLAVSATALYLRGRREQAQARAEASALAHKHLTDPSHGA